MLAYDIEKLERARMIKGWNKTQIAEAAGVSRAAITQIWQGKHKSPSTIKVITEALDLKIEDILVVVEERRAK